MRVCVTVAYGAVAAAAARQAQEQRAGALARPTHPVPAPPNSQRIIVETITMTTVTERRIVGGITDNRINLTASQTPSADVSLPTPAPVEAEEEEEAPALPPKESHAAKALLSMANAEPPPDPGSLSGILKGGKLWKSETVGVNLAPERGYFVKQLIRVSFPG